MVTEYVLDGSRITSLEAFYDEVSDKVIPDIFWGRNLNALDDILRGGFGTPDEGFVIRWQRSDLSRQSLGYHETARQLERRLQHCHPESRENVQSRLSAARTGKGSTVFDWLVEIIQDHGEGGTQANDNVRLLLE